MDEFKDLFSRPIPLTVASEFFVGLKLAAQELGEEAAAPSSPFAVPVEEVLLHLKGLVGHEFKMHQWYIYYAEILRGENRGGLAELFEELAPKELEDAQYFLRRISALAPQGVQLPVVPAPKATSDFATIVQTMLVEEQRAVLLLQHLRTVCGSDPMGYTVEGMMGEEQTHADLLQQYMPSDPKAKLAEAMALVKSDPKGPQKMQVTPESVMASQQRAVLDQTMAENQDLKQRLLETSTMAAQHAEAAEAATAAQQATESQLAEAQGAADMAMQQATMSQQEAAMEADAKMRLAIRVQQIRQQLAGIVAQDPVAEEGADVPAISTPAQAGMQQEAAMMGMDPAAAGGGAPGQPQQGGAPAKKPAEKSDDKGKDDKPGVEVKVAGVLQLVAQRLGKKHAVSEVAAELPKGGEAKSAGLLMRAAQAAEGGIAHLARSRPGQLLTGAHARRLGQEANSWLQAAGSQPGAAKVRGIGMGLQQRARTEGMKVMGARAVAGAGVGLGAAGLAAPNPEPAKVAMSIEALRQLEERLLAHESSDRKPTDWGARLQRLQARRDPDGLEKKTAGVREHVRKVLHSAGKDLADGAAGSQAVKRLEGRMEGGLRSVAGASLAGSAIAAGTSAHQGRKTRKAIEESRTP